MAIFTYCALVLDPIGLVENCDNNIHVIYISLKSSFSGLQFCR